MKILNTHKDPAGPTDEDVDALRRMINEALNDPDGFIIIKGASIEIDSDGNIILKKD